MKPAQAQGHLTQAQIKDRKQTCKEKGLCFISLMPLHKDAKEVRGFLINPKFF